MDADATDIQGQDTSKALPSDRPETMRVLASRPRALPVHLRPLMPAGLGLIALGLCLGGLLALAGR